ncbi:hypothetical protein [Pararhodobacter zhoushanensis]|uniref:Apolipoprotein acyltransferase n=1 Tax=Pararhodobacter zhoushanensis TaxID=2479545 RepID=A0ABT3H1D9_9RHOB|nr:hypothetical protein [Pararhodobacter zhoushanensis]MCW1933641.1 hypothetical protein [Pararhodobacter zhoushanensis]
MVILAGILLGAVWGGFYARRKGGSGPDMAQYAGVWGIIGGLLFTFLAVGLDRFI